MNRMNSIERTSSCGQKNQVRRVAIPVQYAKNDTCNFLENAADIIMAKVSSSFHTRFFQVWPLWTPFGTLCNTRFSLTQSVTAKPPLELTGYCYVILRFFLLFFYSASYSGSLREPIESWPLRRLNFSTLYHPLALTLFFWQNKVSVSTTYISLPLASWQLVRRSTCDGTKYKRLEELEEMNSL